MKKVYLAVGHGRRDDGTWDPGAVAGRWNEQTAGDPVVAAAAEVLLEAGFDVMQEAYRDDPNFRGTVRAANAWGADVLVSVHYDWSGAPVGAFGHWVSAGGKAVGDAVYAAVEAAGFPMRPSWHKRRTDLYVLNRSAMPAMLWECGRIGQTELDTKDEQELMGRAIGRGIAAWAGVDIEDDGGGSVAVEEKVDRIIEMLTERTERGNIAREVEVVKQAVGRIDQLLPQLPRLMAAEVGEGRSIADDVARLRRSVRALCDHLGLETEHPVADGYEVEA